MPKLKTLQAEQDIPCSGANVANIFQLATSRMDWPLEERMGSPPLVVAL